MATQAPSFRRDLKVSFSEDGEYRYAELGKPDGESVRLYDFEYHLACELDGRPVDTVARSASEKLGMELDGKQVEEFARSLAELGLLDPPADQAPPGPEAGAPNKQTWHTETSEPTAMMQGMSELLAGATRRTAELDDDQLLAADSVDDQPAARPAGARPAVAGSEYSFRSEHAPTAPTGVPVSQYSERPTKPTDTAMRAASTAPSFPTAPGGGPPRPPAAATPPPLRKDLIPDPTVGSEPGVPDAGALPTSPAPDRPSAGLAAAAMLDDPSGVQAMPGPAASATMAPAKGKGSSWLVWAILGALLAAAAVGAAWKFMSGGKAPPTSVRTLVPSPVAVYRWFNAEGRVVSAAPDTLSFSDEGSEGTVIEIRSAGDHFTRGDVLALLAGGKPLADELFRLRARLAAALELRAAQTDGPEASTPPAAPPETKRKSAAAAAAAAATTVGALTDRIAKERRLIEDTETALRRFAIIAQTDGAIAEALVTVGARVSKGGAAIRLAGSRHRAVFALSRADAETSQRLGFCRVLVADRPMRCTFASDARPDGAPPGPAEDVGPASDDDADAVPVAVEIENNEAAADPALTPGALVQLARARFDAVFTVPLSALVDTGEHARLFVASPAGRAELRVVALADRSDTEAVVAQGLDVGDAVILDAPRTLVAWAPVLVTEQRFE